MDNCCKVNPLAHVHAENVPSGGATAKNDVTMGKEQGSGCLVRSPLMYDDGASEKKKGPWASYCEKESPPVDRNVSPTRINGNPRRCSSRLPLRLTCPCPLLNRPRVSTPSHARPTSCAAGERRIAAQRSAAHEIITRRHSDGSAT